MISIFIFLFKNRDVASDDNNDSADDEMFPDRHIIVTSQVWVMWSHDDEQDEDKNNHRFYFPKNGQNH